MIIYCTPNPRKDDEHWYNEKSDLRRQHSQMRTTTSASVAERPKTDLVVQAAVA